jgi:hypothetical protein
MLGRQVRPRIAKTLIILDKHSSSNYIVALQILDCRMVSTKFGALQSEI